MVAVPSLSVAAPAEAELPGGVPDGVKVALAAVAARTGEVPRLAEHWWGKQRWVALTDSYAVYVAPTETARRSLALEEARLRWAASQGIPVPEVVELTGDWLITRRVSRAEQAGPAFVAGVIEAARRVAAAAPPPPELLSPADAGRPGLPTRLYRVARMAGGPVPVRLFWKARRAAAGLPRDTLSHGDFIRSNLPFDARAGRVYLVDWERLGYAPAQTDLLTLWPHLPAAEDRQMVLDEALRRSEDRRALGTLHRWLTVRALARLTAGPRRGWDHRVGEVAARVREADANASAWGA